MSTVFSSEFRGLDPNLPTIAALAAAEIDDLISNRAQQIENVSLLANLLRTSFQATSQVGGGAKQLLDPVGTDVFARSLRYSSNQNLASLDDLAKLSLDLATKMTSVADHKDASLLEELKKFCIVLSRYALSSKERLDDFPAYPKYKR